MKAIGCSEQSACDSTIPATSDSARAKKVIKKTVNSNRNKANKCSVCKKVMRSDTVKRHMISKHSRVLNSNQIKKVNWDARPYKDYHKPVTCSVCRKVFRSNYLKKHMIAKHKDVLNAVEQHRDASKADAKKSEDKTFHESYEQKVTSATACAMLLVTNTLHTAFTHIHDETVALLKTNGDPDASERTANLLLPIKKKLVDANDNEIKQVANSLIRARDNNAIEI